MKLIILICGINFSLFICGINSFAVTKIWTGSVSTDWSVGSNWGGTTPDLNDNVIIPSVTSGIYPVISKSILLGNGTILINSNLGSGASLIISKGGSLIVNGLITILAKGKFIMDGNSASLNGITTSGEVYFKGGLITSSGYITVNSGSFSQSGGIIHLAEDSDMNPTENLVVNGGTVTQSGGTFFVKDFVSLAGTFNQTGSSAVFRIYHDWKPALKHTFSSESGTVQYSGASSEIATFQNALTQFNNIIIDASSDPGFENDPGSLVKISGNLINNNSTLNNNGNVTFTFNGPGIQTITSSSGNFLNNLTIDKPGGLLNLASSMTITGILTMTSGNISTGSNLLTLGTGTKTPGLLNYTSGVIITGSEGGFKRWFVNEIVSNILFPVGTSISNNAVSLSFIVAPIKGGTIISKYVSLDPGSNSSIPMNDANYSIDENNAVGFWQIDAANGLVGGTYSLLLKGQDFYPAGTEISNYPHLRILKKSAPNNNWTYMFLYSKLK
jgi:hypothetical protein